MCSSDLGSSESGDEHLVVLVAELHATIFWHVGSDSLVVLFELHSHALTHGGVGLLGLNTNLVDNDASGVGGAGEGLLPLGNLMRRLVLLVGPPVISQLEYHLRPLTS